MPNHKSIHLDVFARFLFLLSAVAARLGIPAILRKLKNVVQDNEAESETKAETDPTKRRNEKNKHQKPVSMT